MGLIELYSVWCALTRASCLDTCNNTTRTYWKYPHCQAAAGQPYSGTWTVWYFMNGEDERELGSKERKREITRVLMYTQKLVFSSFTLSSVGLSNTAHIWNTLRNLTPNQWVSVRSSLDSKDWHTVKFKIWNSESNLIVLEIKRKF